MSVDRGVVQALEAVHQGEMERLREAAEQTWADKEAIKADLDRLAAEQA